MLSHRNLSFYGAIFYAKLDRIDAGRMSYELWRGLRKRSFDFRCHEEIITVDKR